MTEWAGSGRSTLEISGNDLWPFLGGLRSYTALFIRHWFIFTLIIIIYLFTYFPTLSRLAFLMTHSFG